MPIYEYRCDTCDQVFEATQRISDAPLDKCPTCGNPVQKMVSRTSFQLKGTGWYASDYKKPPVPAPPKADKTEKKSEVKAESAGKTDAKADKKGTES